MDYIASLVIYLASVMGVLVSIGGMIAAKNEPKMVGFFSLCSIVFCFTLYIGGVMVQNIN